MNMDVRQDQAINTTGTNIIVSASAGAGKTRVLVERLVKRCVKDHVGMNEVLAVTFTEAAAAEMKNRISASLSDLASNAETEEEQQWLKSQLVLLNDADITTIDSFCLNLIRKYYTVIGLDPAAVTNVLDESAKRAMQEAAFHEALDAMNVTDHDTLLAFLEEVSPRSEDFDTLKDIVFAITRAASQTSDTDAWLAKAETHYDHIRRFDDIPGEVRSAFFARIDLLFNTMTGQMKELLDLAPDNPKAAKKLASIEEANNLLESCRAPLEERNYDAFRTAFLLFGEAQSTPAGGKGTPFSDLRDAFYKSCESLTAILYDSDQFVKDIQDLAPYARMLVQMSRHVMRRYAEMKQEEAAIDFEDMERFAWDIITRNDCEVAKIYRKRLKEVMVDEFQDTSVLQDDIIRMIANPGTIFRVGDVKQSIYRFRGAKPSLMRSLMQDDSIKTITLDHNYRSLETIIRFSNTLFPRLMNIEGIEDRYSDDDIVSPGRDEQKKPDAEPIRMILISKPEAETEDETESASAKELKATWIANRMIELHEDGHRWNEFAVLVRSHAEKYILQSVFARAGIPADIDTREGFFNSDLARYILAVLSAAADASDDISLLTSVSGELFELTDEELAQLKIRHRKLSAGIREEHPEIIEWLRYLRNLSHSGMTEVLNEIAMYNGFYEKLRDSSKANFDFLYEKAIALSRNAMTLYDFISMMKIGADERSSNASCRSKDDDVVTVTTIHQSKGLQYKTVFLWAGGMNPRMDARNAVIVGNEIPLGLKHVDMPWHTTRPSIYRLASDHLENLADIEEYTRVLYVALTRAEETMYIVDLEKNAQPFHYPFALSDLTRRKGITGLITAAMDDIPGLFEIHVVMPEALRHADETETRFVEELPCWTKPFLPAGELLRPSEHQITRLPDLSIGNKDRGTRYGTRMHEIIAELPNRPWTRKDLSFDGLSEHDTEALLAFSASDLYQKALTMDIQKEMPFYAEDPEHGQRIMGVMDFVAFSEDEILLIDFKTDALAKSAIKARYSDQLYAYERALNLLYPGIPVRTYAYSLHHHCAIPM